MSYEEAEERLLMFQYLCVTFLEHRGDITAVDGITSFNAFRSGPWA